MLLADAGSGALQVFDATGRLVASRMFTGTDSLYIDTSTWPAGAYLLHVRTEQGVAVRKVVVGRI